MFAVRDVQHVDVTDQEVDLAGVDDRVDLGVGDHGYQEGADLDLYVAGETDNQAGIIDPDLNQEPLTSNQQSFSNQKYSSEDLSVEELSSVENVGPIKRRFNKAKDEELQEPVRKKRFESGDSAFNEPAEDFFYDNIVESNQVVSASTLDNILEQLNH